MNRRNFIRLAGGGTVAAATAGTLAACLDGIDLLLTPCLPKGVPDRETVTTSCPGFDPRALAAMHRHHAYINYLGLPALVMPVGSNRRFCAKRVMPSSVPPVAWNTMRDRMLVVPDE